MEQFKQFSIRGRFAYALRCVEIALDSQGIRDGVLDKVLAKAWEFMSRGNLSDWESETHELTPRGLLSKHSDALKGDHHALTPKEVLCLKTLYQNMPTFIPRMLEDTFWVGFEYLYSIVPEGSPKTLGNLSDIVKYMRDNGHQPSGIGLYLGFAFSEDDGWGREMNQAGLPKIGLLGHMRRQGINVIADI